ncbi:MAG TPA: hypothetical protein VMH37_03165 [Candidatus Binataceae bacterium]|nr:hypothetical protein [Candidatus Binataceae bacterium]
MTPKPAERRRALVAITTALAAVALVACTSPNSPRGVVDRFIAAHYMAIDLKAAEPLCTGLALDKLHEEMKLTEGQHIDETTRKPIVHYKLTAERESPDHIEYLFRATIDVPDGGSFEKNWMITARKESDTWKVSNFSEYD